MKYTFPIEPVDCYCSLLDFYKNAAIRCGIDITGKTKYDCTKICVSKEVHEQLLHFLIIQENYDRMSAVMLLGMAGLKANLEPSPSFPYYVEVEDGFVVREAKTMTAAQATELAWRTRQSAMNDIRNRIENGIEKACRSGKGYYQYYGSLPEAISASLVEQGYSIKYNRDLTHGVDIYTISW